MVYDGIINKPDIDEIIIEHYGVKGMKWRKHIKKAYDYLTRNTKKAKARRKSEYIGKKVADDEASGRYGLKDINDLAYTGENARRFNKYFRSPTVADSFLRGFKDEQIHNSPGSRGNTPPPDREAARKAYIEEHERIRRRKNH